MNNNRVTRFLNLVINWNPVPPDTLLQGEAEGDSTDLDILLFDLYYFVSLFILSFLFLWSIEELASYMYFFI